MTLIAADDRNADQVAYWNGPSGERWRARQQDQDILLAPVADLLLQRAAPSAGEAVLDVGCGCGFTSIELARRVMPGGRVLGVDISAPMLQRARERTPAGLPVDFIMADATAYGFEPGAADLLFSRFGVMFFAEPQRSFTNMRRGLRSGARLAFACWREPKKNPWLLVPFEEVCRHVPRPPATAPEEPGPFAFADERRVRDILGGAGFREIRLEAVELSLDIGLGRGLESAVDAAAAIGPASRALEGQPPDVRAAAVDSIRAALRRYQAGSVVALPGEIWIVSATNP
ncbi:MAG: methyltransferase domain-containing protein [Gammaproteobacteria bacterium]|nr:methyltransferase domain-containing protein [Gammaproteobacteria bacterium]